MCDPFSILAVVGTANSIKQTRDAKKERAAAAEASRQQAQQEKTEADTELRQTRREEAGKTTPRSNFRAQPSTLFAPRSFFAG